MSSLNSVSTFIQMLDNFLGELSQTFPDNKTLTTYLSKYEMLKKTNKKAVLDLFLTTIQPFSELIVSKNEQFMLMDHESGFFNDIQLKEIWTSPECTDTNKDAIWAHLNYLYMFAVTINMIPSNLMSSIEQLAESYSSNMDENALKDFKPEMLMSSMQNIMKTLGNN